ncbi:MULTISPECIES: hypothetical protein [Rufibacter]|uniref:DNA-binding NarL/FixJ family response regulator n=1 Tax=Rufibacter quisquiliarum TaxID=1549639 RepID=A0A839GAY5_9BACT|nr:MULTISPECIES: hypothetical protein [Rufibacter]MBA9076704.1 DNA-binding NarL/FixJ family response regulator [Rufibacter quisquiliarum]
MSHTYRLLLLEDDKAFAGSLCEALNKQNNYLKPIEIRSFSYEEYERQFDEARNSSREIIVFGGREALNFEPDVALVKLLLAQQDRTHLYVMTPSLEGRNVLHLWHPGVSGIIERNDSAKSWLVLALQRLQNRQQPRNNPKQVPARSSAPGFFGQLRTALFSFFM